MAKINLDKHIWEGWTVGAYIKLENGEYDYGTIIRTIGDRDYENKPFRTYEEAELACLIKLIEITKEK